MIWLTYRQHRAEMLISCIVFALLLVVLLVTGVNITHVAQQAGLFTCSLHHGDCNRAQNAVNDYVGNYAFGNETFYITFQYILLCLPLLVGMFFGARLVAQEFEHGTYRLVWTQGIAWSRWLFTKIGVLAGFFICATGLLYAIFIWWKVPVLAVPAFTLWGYQNYDIWGFVAIAYTVFAFALGIAAGSLIRKTVPAMAIVLVVFVAIRLVLEVFVRPYLLPPLVLVRSASHSHLLSIPAQSWVIARRVERQGKPSSLEDETICSMPSFKGEAVEDYNNRYDQCLAHYGFQEIFTYQPPDRLNALQGIESGIYIFFTILSIGIAFWAIRRSLT